MMRDTNWFGGFSNSMGSMNSHDPTQMQFQLIRTAFFLWVLYLFVMIATDLAFLQSPFAQTSVAPRTFFTYYGSNIGFSVLFYALCRLAWARQLLKTVLLPLTLILLVLLPRFMVYALIPYSSDSLTYQIVGLVLRLFPVLMLGLILIVWQYDFREIVLYTLAYTFSDIFLTLLFVTRNPSVELNRLMFSIQLQSAALVVAGYFAGQIMRLLRNQRVALSQANEHLANYASTLEELSVSRERNRIARELHDTLAHTLTGLSVQLETAKAYWKVDSDAAYRIIENSLDATRSGLEETRRTLKALRATPLDDLGLEKALTVISENAAARGALALDLQLPHPMPALPEQIEHSIYRVVQEAISNVLHHANAKRLWIHLKQTAQEITLIIGDDGQGFLMRDYPGHFGLAGMQERAYLVGGELAIATQPGQGTTVTLTIRKNAS